jgi:hypothetical protein
MANTTMNNSTHTTTDNIKSKKGDIHNLKTPFGEPVVDVFKGMFKKDPKPKDPWWRVYFFQI